jgi:cyclic pyranopterin phosphate synthase
VEDEPIKLTEGWHGDLIALRVSVTDQCRSRCLYCTPAEGAPRFAAKDLLGDEEIVRFVRTIKASFGLAKVRLTGGEPLDRPGIVRLAGLLADEGVGDLALTTNGQRLHEFAAQLKQAGLRRVNVSLNSLKPATFRAIAGGGDPAESLRGIDAALSAGLAPVKINMTVLRGMNDHEIADIARFGIALGAVVRFIELMPIGPAADRHRELFVSSDEVLGCLKEHFDLRPLAYCPGSSSREYQVAGDTPVVGGGHPWPPPPDAAARDGRRAMSSGVVGLISPCSQPFCVGCNRLRLKANGDLVGCLATGSSRNILPLPRADGPSDEEQIRQSVLWVMGQKRAGEGFTGQGCMVTMGG